MFNDNDKYPHDDQYYEEMMQWLESEHAYELQNQELSEEEINEMAREEINRSLTAETLIISQTPVNNKNYQPMQTGA